MLGDFDGVCARLLYPLEYAPLTVPTVVCRLFSGEGEIDLPLLNLVPPGV